MSGDEEYKASILSTAQSAVGDMLYTVIYDTCNEMIEAGMNSTAALECANRVATKYLEQGIRMRKKPAPRVHKAVSAGHSTDAVTAASRKMKQKMSDKFVWVVHPSDSSFLYSTSVTLANGYPVKQAISGKVVGVIDDTTTHSITTEDARIALSLGLDVDFESVTDNKSRRKGTK